MTRLSRLAAPAAAVVMLAAAPGASPAAGDGPSATAAKTCKVGNSRGYGTTYVLSITTRRVGCRRAKSVVRAFHACRSGARGRCHHRVKGFRCKENRTFGRGSFDSRVTCRRGGKRVKHTYTQWT